MKKLLLLIFLNLAVGLTLANGQCVDDANSICVPRADVDRATKMAIELKAARETIAAFQNEREATAQERASAARLIDRLNGIVNLQDRMTAEYETVLKLYKEVVEMQSELIEKMTKQLNKPRSAWSRFLSAVKTVITLAAGISIGRGGL